MIFIRCSWIFIDDDDDDDDDDVDADDVTKWIFYLARLTVDG